MSWLIQPLGPALVLGMGSIVLILLHAYLRRGWAPVIALSTLVIALLVQTTLQTSHAAIAVGRPWVSVLFDMNGGLVWRSTAWRWGGNLIILVLALVGTLLAWDEGDYLTPYYRAIDLALIAASTLVLFADNLLTLASMWILMESIALARLGLEPRHQPETGRAGLSAASALLVAVACPLSGSALLTTPFPAAVLTPLVQGILVLAIMLRAAIYPLHGWLTHSRLTSPTHRISIYLIPATASLWLLGILNRTAHITWLGHHHWVTFLSLAILGSALAAWADPICSRSLDFVCANRAGLVVLMMILWPGQGALPLAGWLLAFSLGLGLLLAAREGYHAWGGRWPGVLAVLTLLGYPLTAGFLGQPWLNRLAPSATGPLPWLALTAGDVLVLATLLRDWHEPHPILPRLSGQEIRLLTAAILLAVPILLVGLRPSLAFHLSEATINEGGIWMLLVGVPLIAWARLLLIAAFAAWLWRGPRIGFAGWRGARPGFAHIVRLDWGYAIIQELLRAAGASWRTLSDILEGEGYLGWVILTFVLIWLLIHA
ncbi:MAG: hypothetical protein J7M34_05400 [Anaerolineae bacterium]|nr:hypothetical protein [Anaerolineae bacterium]